MKKLISSILCIAASIGLVVVANGQRLSGNVRRNAERDARAEAEWNNHVSTRVLKGMLDDVKKFDDEKSITTRLRVNARGRIYRNTANHVPVFLSFSILKRSVIKAIEDDQASLASIAQSGSILFAANRTDVEVQEVGAVEVAGKFYVVALVRLIDSDEIACVFADWIFQE